MEMHVRMHEALLAIHFFNENACTNA